MKNQLKLFFVLVALMTFGQSFAQVNMDTYITMDVFKGKDIKLDFIANAPNTDIRIVSGSTDVTITVGQSNYGEDYYTAGDHTMTVYGNLKEFICRSNSNNILGLDLSNNKRLQVLRCDYNGIETLDVSGSEMLQKLYCDYNWITSLKVDGCTALQELYCSYNMFDSLELSGFPNLRKVFCYFNSMKYLNCQDNPLLTELVCRNNGLTELNIAGCYSLEYFNCYSNNLSTQTIDNIYCELPDRSGDEPGYFFPMDFPDDSNLEIVMATNAQNAIDKNWEVQYWNNSTNITGTTGTFECEFIPVNMNKYVTLSVPQGETVSVDLAGQTNNASVKVVSGDFETTFTISNEWNGANDYESKDGTITFYGNIKSFDCSNNESSITALEIKNNTVIKEVYCQNNAISILDISKNHDIEILHCYKNNITNIMFDGNITLKDLSCYQNNLTGLNVKSCIELLSLACAENNITSLDLNRNEKLTSLSCYSNELEALNITKNKKLETILCFDNNFSIEKIEKLYCDLPDRSGEDYGNLYILNNQSSSNYDLVMTSTPENANNLNWKVKFFEDDSEVTGTTGNHVCGNSIDIINEKVINIYPNPFNDVLFIDATQKVISITVFDITGKIITEINNDAKSISTATWSKGLYLIEIKTDKDVKTFKVVKE